MAARTTPKPVEIPEAEAPVQVTYAPEEHPTLAQALAAFQMELPSVRKGNTAAIEGRSSYTYSYADLTDVSEVGLPLLGKHGLAWHTGLDTAADGSVVLTWALMHGASNEVLHGTLPVGRPGSDWRQMGSAITYARRYALTAATGIAPGGDDDDAAASVTAGDPRQDSRPQAQQERRQAPIQSPPRENLPEGLYDLTTVVDRASAEAMYQTARVAQHLTMLVAEENEAGEVAPMEFGQWLIKTGTALAEAEADPVAAEIAAHEAALAEAEAAESAKAAEAPKTDDRYAPEGDR